MRRHLRQQRILKRLWSFSGERPTIYKNTTKLRANTFGFYALNGNSVIEFRELSKKEDVCEFLREVRKKNPEKRTIIVLDNFSSHKAKDTVQCAEDCGIELVYLPPYSPDPKSNRIHLEEYQKGSLTEIYRQSRSYEESNP